jgi:hypothetical protein
MQPEKIYQKNLNYLKKREPKLPKKLREISLEIELKDLKEEISIEPEVIKNADVLVVLGFGEGKTIERVLEISSSKTFILIIEKDITSFKASLFKRDLSSIFNSNRISISVDEDPFLSTLIRLERYFSILTFREMYILKIPSSIKKNPFYYQEVEEKLKEAIKISNTNIETFLDYSSLWKKHILSNLPLLLKIPGIDILNSKFKNFPAVIICAGPSLDKNIHKLKNIEDKALIISTDTALNTTLKNKIIPHMVMSVDGTRKNFSKYYQKLKIPKEIYLIGDLIVYPKTFSMFSLDNIFILSDGHPLVQWLGRFTYFNSYLSRGGNVSTACFNFALKLGCDPIIFIGQDLSFPKGRFYTKGVSSKTRKHFQKNLEKHPSLIEVEDIYGKKVLTSKAMYDCINWFQNRLSYIKVKCINATEGGAYIKGMENISLEESIRRYCQDSFPILNILKESHQKFKTLNPKILQEKIEELSEEYQRVNNLCIQALNLVKRFSLKESSSLYFQNLFSQIGTIKNYILKNENFLFCERLQIEPLIYQLSSIQNEISFSEKIKILNKIFRRLKYLSSYTVDMLLNLKEKIIPLN